MDDMPILAREDEEFQMLLDVTKEFPRQSGSIPQKSGKATMKVIRDHLVENHHFRIAKLDAKIPEKGKMNLLFFLKTYTPTKLQYSLKDDVDTVLKITNNAVGKATSKKIGDKFDELEQLNQKLRFATVVLSESISYNYPIDIREVFTLVARKKRAHKLYLRETVMKMLEEGELWRTREWEKLIDYLKK